MSNVKLEIGGRQFTVACAEGEEAHVTGLGEMIAAKISTMGDVAGQSESRMLLFAALLLADELHDANLRAANSRAANSHADSQPAPQPGLSAVSAQRLDEIAERLENLASRLES